MQQQIQGAAYAGLHNMIMLKQRADIGAVEDAILTIAGNVIRGCCLKGPEALELMISRILYLKL